MRLLKPLPFLGLAACCFGLSPAQAQGLQAHLQQRLTELVSRINQPQPELMAPFAPVFREQVSASSLEALLADLRTRLGPCRPLAQAPGSTPSSASVLLRCERGIQALDLSVEAEAPHRINGFFVRQRYGELSQGF
ncbi:MAG: hypothetical protein JZU58_29195 [Curvibacter lanceolatus]|uniref:hypothetical protein n=1 Tax=Curvibacter lanceolatus TaxID=86182 RepID=UPI002353E8E7|nr:hypothetical protein [Curvibacter lanceolatus]MBV5296435.1 hypothetical protein [Curvibacter lanceolatus]